MAACGNSCVDLSYFPLLQVGILYFQPSVFRCILLRWVRLLGFATVYGTLTLKLYRCDTHPTTPRLLSGTSGAHSWYIWNAVKAV